MAVGTNDWRKSPHAHNFIVQGNVCSFAPASSLSKVAPTTELISLTYSACLNLLHWFLPSLSLFLNISCLNKKETGKNGDRKAVLSHTSKCSDTALLMSSQLIQGCALPSLKRSWDKLQHARRDPARDTVVPKKETLNREDFKRRQRLSCIVLKQAAKEHQPSTLLASGSVPQKWIINIYLSLENKGQPTWPYQLFWLNTSNRKWTRALQSADDTVCVFDFKHIKRSMGGKL